MREPNRCTVVHWLFLRKCEGLATGALQYALGGRAGRGRGGEELGGDCGGGALCRISRGGRGDAECGGVEIAEMLERVLAESGKSKLLAS
jgi:hypothetical protein